MSQSLEQRDSEEHFFYPLVIKASAGSGKTFELAMRYLALLARGESEEKILATTFTRKAAGEIKERIISLLSEAALSEETAKFIGKQIGLDFTSVDAQKILARILRNLSQLNICTLDSFFYFYCKEFFLRTRIKARLEAL